MNKITAKEGATEADIQEVLEHKPCTTYASKCIGACLAEMGGLVSQHALHYIIWILFLWIRFVEIILVKNR